MKIAYICMDEGGCAYYRSILPLETLAEKEGLHLLKIEKGAESDKYLKLVSADVIQLGRLAPAKPLRDQLERIREQGAKLVLEYDDNVFQVNPYSPHYLDYGTEEYTDETTGIQIWKDGIGGFSLERNLARLECVKEGARMVDMVTVTQPHLAEVFKPYNDNVVCLPNCVDMREWRKLPLVREDPEEIRLFWQGGCSHFIDWLHLSDVLPTIMQMYPKVKLVIMGQMFDGTLAGVPKDRIEHHRWVHFSAYPMKTAILDPDISLIPLDDNPFNHCKSNIKWVEMAAFGVPACVSAVTPYKEAYNGKNMVMVDNTPDAWVKGLSALIDDRILRASIAGEAQRTAAESFDINREYVQWRDAYRGLLV